MFSHTWENIKGKKARKQKAQELLDERKRINDAWEASVNEIKTDTDEKLQKIASPEGLTKKGKDGVSYVTKEEVLGREKSKLAAADEVRSREIKRVTDTTSRTWKAKEKEAERKAQEKAEEEARIAREKFKKTAKGKIKNAEEKMKELPGKMKKVYEKTPKSVKVAGAGTIVLGTGALVGKKVVDSKKQKENRKLFEENYKKNNKKCSN